METGLRLHLYKPTNTMKKVLIISVFVVCFAIIFGLAYTAVNTPYTGYKTEQK